MKYCKKCKIAAKETDALCSKCKQPLSTLGSGPPVAAGPRPAPVKSNQGAASSQEGPKSPPSRTTFTLSGQLQQMEELKLKNVKRGRNLGVLCLLAALTIMFILFQVYSRTVLAYAVLENVKFEQDPIAESQITVSFDVKSPGKVAFDRRSGTGHTEKLDDIAATKGHKTVWAWPSDPKTGIDFSVVSRGGLMLASKEQHFDVTRKGIGVEVVFIMDITNSMGPFIRGLKENCKNFANEVRKRGLDCRLGLIGFGDVEYNEPLRVFDLTEDVQSFQSNVSGLTLVNGVDNPESSVEALEKALEIEFRPHTRICFVHITDADCHHPERIAGIASQLKERGFLNYSISRKPLRRRYAPLCVNGGDFFDINDSKFETILQKIAKSIANQISSE
jgi:hypothetical protein